MPMKLKPKVTVVVPTRERGDVLPFTLSTLIKQDYENLQILVCDNNSADCTRDVVYRCNDPRIRYVNPGQRLSMSANWDFALSQVGETDFVAFIGDDDGIVEKGISMAVELLVRNNVKALRAVPVDYHWPKRNNKDHGKLTIQSTTKTEVRSAKTWLDKVVRQGSGYTNLPVLYNGGLVAIDVVRALKIEDEYFLSPIPDVYSGVALASVLETYLYTTLPIFINGASHHSIGTSFFARLPVAVDKVKSEPSQMFLSEGNRPHHMSIPKLPDGSYPRSTRLMIVDAFLQSAFLRKNAAGLSKFDLLVEVMAGPSASEDKQTLEWAEIYSRESSLNFTQVKLTAAWRSTCRSAMMKLYSLKTKSKKHVVDRAAEPLLTIEEAADYVQRFVQLQK